MKTVTIPVFTFEELSKEAQMKVVNDTIDFMIETADDGSSQELLQALEKANGMLTPWFAAAYIWEGCKEEVDALCQEFMYFKNGQVYSPESY